MHADPERTTPIGLVHYAREFFGAAIAADAKIGQRPGFEIIAPIPVMYLVGHAIELGLKAYLTHEGVPLKDLPKNKYGHNLEKCFKCVFHTKPATDSRASLPPIPDESCH